MPQMAPLSWILLFVFFCSMFFIFNSLNYYCFFTKLNNKNNENLNKNISKNLNWKW